MSFETNHDVVGTVTLDAIVQRTRPGYTGQDRSVYPGSAAWDKGIKYADEVEYVTIAVNNVWGAQANNGGCVSSYEKIGYHAGSVDFIAGLLAADCPVYAYCDNGWHQVA